MIAVSALVGALFGVGVWLIVTGLRSVPSDAMPTTRSLRWRLPSDAASRLARAVAVGAVLLIVTRWPVAAVAGAAAGWWATDLFGGRAERERAVARTEAIAVWTEMLRDTMAGAHGLEEAITTTAGIAPEAVRAEVARLAARAQQAPLSVALAEFAEQVAHPTADLVVAALRLAADDGVRDLGELLSTLATAARDETAMRLRVEAARARLRTAVQVIAITSVVMVTGLVVLNPGYVSIYRSGLGQAVLALIAALWGAALWWLAKMSRFVEPERFLAPASRVAR